MKPRVLSLAVACLLTGMLTSRAATQGAKLAVLALDNAQEQVADVLTARLSKYPGLVLLERGEVNRILAEQKLFLWAGADYVKAGQILAADGLLLLETQKRGASTLLSARLIATRPGVLLEVETAPSPLKDPSEWCDRVLPHFAVLFPKLTVLAQDAIPISVLSLRSSLPTPEARALERELTLLLIHRLSRERELFVLERQGLREVMLEEQLRPDEREAFWTGRHLLEGTIDQSSLDKEQITISARIGSGGAAQPVSFEVAGPRQDTSKVVELLTAKVLNAFHRSSGTNIWRPLDEAGQFFGEAKWALRWGLFHEAQQASESAWALGQRTRDVALVRLRSYAWDLGEKVTSASRGPETFDPSDWGLYQDPEAFPDADKLRSAIRGLELFCADSQSLATNIAGADAEWADLGVDLLSRAGTVLLNFYQSVEFRPGNESALAELRSLAREAATLLERICKPPVLDPEPFSEIACLSRTKWLDAGLWFEKPEQVLELQRRVLESGWRPSYPSLLPYVIAWSWEDRKRVPGLVKTFVADLIHSTNVAVRLEGLFLAVVRAPFDEHGSVQRCEKELIEALWEHRQQVFASELGAWMLVRTDRVLRHKYDIGSRDYPRDPFAGFLSRLRKDYLEHALLLNPATFDALFRGSVLSDRPKFSPAEAQELLPLLEQFEKRFAADAKAKGQILDLRQSLARSLKDPSVIPPAPSPAKGPAIGFDGPRAGPPPAEQPEVIQFKRWGLDSSADNEQNSFTIANAFYRDGKVWCLAQYGPRYDFRIRTKALMSLNPTTEAIETILLPEINIFGPYGSTAFDVASNNLYMAVRDTIVAYSLFEKTWATNTVPTENGAGIKAIGGQLYLNTGESLLEWDPKTKTAQILASSRRRPPLNPLDELGGFSAIFAGPTNTLGILAHRRLFAFSPTSRNLTEFGVSFSTNFPPSQLHHFFSETGTLFSEMGYNLPTSMISIGRNGPTVDLLLLQPVRVRVPERQQSGAARRGFEPPRWDWPRYYPLETVLATLDGRSLWVLSPRRAEFFGLDLTAKFSDARNATLFRFDPEFRQPMPIPLRFEKDGQNLESFIKPEQTESGLGLNLLIDTPEALVVLSPNSPGHWLIRKSSLAARLENGRATLRQQAKAKP